MSDPRHQDLLGLVHLSEVMLEHAQRGEWDDIPEAERERRRLLENCLAQPVPAESTALVRQCLERILELDRELMRLSVAARDEAAAKLMELRQGRRAQSAYEQF